MSLDINKLKENVKKLLSKKALDLWEAIEWDKEEVGNSKIGFLSLDPTTRPQRIAKFINKKATGINLQPSTGLRIGKTWTEEMKKKYPEEVPLTEVNKFRDYLVKSYGNKIIPGMSEDLSPDELSLRQLYINLTGIIHKGTAGTRAKILDILDRIEFSGFKLKNTFENFALKLKSAFFVVLLILILLAVIKYLLS
jgi:hypothetical protein